MDLNLFQHQPLFGNLFGPGFDELFAPHPSTFPRHLHETSLFEATPVIDSLVREDDWKLFRSSPGYEITENERTYQIALDVPGIKAADMTVQLERDGRILHITGGRKVEKEGSVSETKFEKRFTIGENVDTEKLSANLADGVLILSAPKLDTKRKMSQIIPISEVPHEQSRLLRSGANPTDTDIM